MTAYSFADILESHLFMLLLSFSKELISIPKSKATEVAKIFLNIIFIGSSCRAFNLKWAALTSQ